jgi:hypothetical protein
VYKKEERRREFETIKQTVLEKLDKEQLQALKKREMNSTISKENLKKATLQNFFKKSS